MYLTSLVDEVSKGIRLHMLPAYTMSLAERNAEIRRDDWSSYITAAVNAIRLSTKDKLEAGQRMLVNLAAGVSAFSKKPWQALAESQVGVNIFAQERWLEPLLRSWAEENAKLITSVPEQYLARVAQRAQDMVRQGRTIDYFKKELINQYGLASARAKLIARTEIAKLNGQISKARQQALRVREYNWLTSADERVRESHKILNGKICQWDDPTVYREPDEKVWKKRSSIGAYEGDPGEDFQCRCISAARIDSLLDELLK